MTPRGEVNGPLTVDECGMSSAVNADPLANAWALEACFARAASSSPSRAVLVPAGSTYRMYGARMALGNCSGATLIVDGTLQGVPNFDAWPLEDPTHYRHFLSFEVRAAWSSSRLLVSLLRAWSSCLIEPALMTYLDDTASISNSLSSRARV